MTRLFNLLFLVVALACLWFVGPKIYRGVMRRMNPPPQAPVRIERSIRVIEGWTVDNQAEQLRALKPAWSDTWQDLAGQSGNKGTFDPILRTEFTFLRTLPIDRSLDGYLFPDTYRLWEDEMPESLVKKQLQTFEQRVYERFKNTPLPAPLKTFDEAIILASIVEKEVRSPEDRKLVAGLFLRRLREGMPLQSDATLTYVTGSKRGRATGDELELASLYNSYKYKGLPPSPIAHPGMTAFEAVFAPTPTTYRYFLTDEAGKVFYGRTFEEHIRNRQRAGY